MIRTSRVVPGFRTSQRSWKELLRYMAVNHDRYDALTYARLCALRTLLERHLVNALPATAGLDARTRQLRGWLGYFAQRPHFRAYRAAVARARPCVRAALRRRWPQRYAWISFHPVRGLFQLRVRGDSVHVALPTPMLQFDTAGFELAAEVVLLDSARGLLRAATRTTAYQALQDELIVLGMSSVVCPKPLVLDAAHTSPTCQQSSQGAQP